MLYYANGTLHTDLSAYVEHITTGLYRIPYTLPLNATAGTYVLVVDASLLTLEGTSIETFIISPTLTGWNPLLVSINATTATIKTDLGLITAKLEALNITVTRIDNTTVTIQTTLGTLEGRITSIEGHTTTIETDIGTLKVDTGSIKEAQQAFATPLYVLSILVLIIAIGAILLAFYKRRKS
jgi:hypothetical protein